MLWLQTKGSLLQGMPLQGCKAGKRPQVFPRGHGEASLPARPESLDENVTTNETVVCVLRDISNGMYIAVNCGFEEVKRTLYIIVIVVVALVVVLLVVNNPPRGHVLPFNVAAPYFLFVTLQVDPSFPHEEVDVIVDM